MRNPTLLAILFLLPAAPALACDTNKGEQPLFSCETENQGQFIQICAIEHGAGAKWTDVQYQYGGEKPSFVYPENPADGAKLLFFSHVTKAGAYISSPCGLFPRASPIASIPRP
jgi:hypothetical protein